MVVPESRRQVEGRYGVSAEEHPEVANRTHIFAGRLGRKGALQPADRGA